MGRHEGAPLRHRPRWRAWTLAAAAAVVPWAAGLAAITTLDNTGTPPATALGGAAAAATPVPSPDQTVPPSDVVPAADVLTVIRPRRVPPPPPEPTLPPPTRPPPTPTTTPPPLRSFTLAATGDLLVHAPVRRAAAVPGGFEFAPLLAAVAPIIRTADLAVCHLETPLTRDYARLSSYPIFNVPADLAPAIAATGWDVCSTASNHSVDQGAAGIQATLSALDSAGVRHAGMGRTLAESNRSTLVDAGGVTVGVISATYGLNGLPLPEGQPWAVQLLDAGQLLARADRARAEGAEFVVMSLHWGAEYVAGPTAAQTTLARQVLAAESVDLIVGHHSHVVQPLERVAGKLVAYGLGNFLSAQQRGTTEDGVILQVRVTETPAGFGIDGVTWVPTIVDHATHHVLPAPPQSAARTDQALQALGVLPDL